MRSPQASVRVSTFIVLAAVAVAALGGAQAPPPAQDAVKKAGQVLADARQALGGDKLATLKTLVASGRTRRVRGNNLVPIEFEIAIELPDKYLRADEFPAEDTDPTTSGFNADTLIQVPAPGAAPVPQPGRAMPPPPAPATTPATAPAAAPSMPPGGRGPAPDPRRARVTALKQEFARLTLGLFAASPAYPLTFAWAAIAEAPQGKADVLEVKGEGTFAARLFVNSETRLPIMVTWTTPPANVIVTVPGQPPPQTIAPGVVVVAGPPAPAASATKEERDAYTKAVLGLRTKAQATPVEQRLYFADYRDVDGLKLPFRLRRAIGAETTEETTVDRFRVNTRIDPKKFAPVK